MQTIPIT
jgi:hypothetical protein